MSGWMDRWKNESVELNGQVLSEVERSDGPKCLPILDSPKRRETCKKEILCHLVFTQQTVNGFYHRIETLLSLLLSCPCSFINISCLAEHSCTP